jgi:hypothetical protein
MTTKKELRELRLHTVLYKHSRFRKNKMTNKNLSELFIKTVERGKIDTPYTNTR